ncbi:MAG TPA: winged helix DNA-binding domain-containing protein [Draconibacterium sp.]|nr:winged helix DNA-binding domain-containing protein [Draconibacterium sp.]
MDLDDIAMLRLYNQQIAAPVFKTVNEIVSWLGAVQAQDYNMSEWAVGVRLPGSTTETVKSAINSGEIIRTHVLRPTWHLVSAADIYWMLELSAPQIRSLSRSRDKELGLTETAINRSNTILEKALRDNRHLTREELVKLLADAGYSNDNNRVSHILIRAEIEGIITSGKIRNGKQTYALLAERVPDKKTMSREEAAIELARRYFTSHGPASLHDFIWWSGLPVKDCRHAVETIKLSFDSEKSGEETYYFAPFITVPKLEKKQVVLLPAYDEFIISYKNRRASLPFENQIRAVLVNGIFRPVIVHNGKVIGIWKRTLKNDNVIPETEYFGSPDKTTKKQVNESLKHYAKFLGKNIVFADK